MQPEGRETPEKGQICAVMTRFTFLPAEKRAVKQKNSGKLFIFCFLHSFSLDERA